MRNHGNYTCRCKGGFNGKNCQNKILAECTFEDDCSSIRIDKQSRFHWVVSAQSTPSYRTGPSKAADGSLYCYAESSRPARSNDVTKITSEFKEINSPSCFSMSYHMYGSTMGKLKVYFEDERNTVIGQSWTMEGNQGEEWMDMDLTTETGKIRFVIEATKGSSFRSDMAVDNLSWIEGRCKN